MTAPETDTSELKPCPHCGKPAMWLHKSQGGYAIICGGTPRCRAAVGLHGGGTSFTEVEALTAWNTRVAVDDLTLDELRGRAIRALREAGWRANDKLSLHSVIETMIAFGINIIRDKPVSCGWPDCGCDADAVCNAALVPAPAATLETTAPAVSEAGHVQGGKLKLGSDLNPLHPAIVAAILEDKARLDWMIANAARVTWSRDSERCRLTVIRDGNPSEPDEPSREVEIGTGWEARPLIDAALEAAQRARK